MAIFTVGANVGVLAGFTLGGLVATRYGWRAAFFIVGVPGLIMAAVVAGFVREPDRGQSDRFQAGCPVEDRVVGVREALAFLWESKVLLPPFARRCPDPVCLERNLGVAAVIFPARPHGVTADKSGIAVGLSLGIGGIVGTLAGGGVLVDRMSSRDLRWPVWIVTISMLFTFIGNLLVFIAPTGTLAMAVFVVPAILTTVWQAPTLAMTQGSAPINMRATAGACYVLIANLIGLGLGPLTVGVLSDTYTRFGAGQDSLRWALLSTVPVGLWAGAHFLLAAQTLRADYAKAQAGLERRLTAHPGEV